jgi:oligopeptidase B
MRDPDEAVPPVAPRRPVTSELHGVLRADDYAWMRESGSAELLEHLAQERRYYDARTAHSRPLQDRLFSEMSSRMLPADWSVSWSRGGPVYYTRTAVGKEYDLFCMSDRDLPAGTSDGSAAERVLLDLNELAAGHDYAALGVCEPSPDGLRLAWSLDTAGDERFELRVRDLATGRDSDPVPGDTYLTCAWSADSSALFYTVPDQLNRPHQVWRLDLDGRQTLVLDEPDARFEVTVEATRNGRIILIQAESRDTTEISWLPAFDPSAAPRVIWPRRVGIEYAVDHLATAPSPAGPDGPDGPDGAGGDGDLLVLTNDGASEFRVVRVPLAAPDPATAVELVPGDPDTRWESVDVIGGFAVVGGRHDAQPFLRVLDLTGGGSHDIEADGPAGRVGLSRNADPTARSVRVCVDSLVQPAQWYDVELATSVRRLVKELEVPSYDVQHYRTERFWATAPDGELVPVSLARHEDTPLDGTAPCLLWGYGAYEACYWPEFDPAVVSLLDRGVVYAMAHIRGGGERGRRWWDDGHLATKHHTFSDFVAAADALADGLVDGARIVSRGLSAGGLLQGAAMGLAPHRWAAVIAEVPFVDCVNSMLDETVPLTVAEWDEWGDPRRPEDFAWMVAYSPYDNPPTGYRPPLLVTGSVNDPRVLVHEPAKWVARLRATAGPEATAPLLFRVELGAGAHAGPAGRYGHLQYEAEVMAYALDAMGIRD